MSHELRSPLFAVKAHLSLLKLSHKLDPSLHSHVDDAISASQDLLSLVNDILDGAQIRSGQFALHPSKTNIVLLASSVVDSFKTLAEQKGLRLYLEVSNDAPQTIYLDAKRLRQVLINLVSNAVKFTQQGEVCVRIEPAYSSNSSPKKRSVDALSISVIDTGEGIPKVELERIFEPFYTAASSSLEKPPQSTISPMDAQTDSSTNPLTGAAKNTDHNNSSSGLGLAIVKSIADASGWKISLFSNSTDTHADTDTDTKHKTKGSTFKVTIAAPINPPPTTPQASKPTTELEGAQSSNQTVSQLQTNQINSVKVRLIKPLRVLIIDDLLVNRHVLKLAFKRIAESHGLKSIQTEETGSGEAAIKLIADNHYDLVLVDWNMPGMSGAELVLKIQSILKKTSTSPGHSTEIAIISGQIDRTLQVVCSQMHINHLLSKPVEIEELEALINTIITKHLIDLN